MDVYISLQSKWKSKRFLFFLQTEQWNFYLQNTQANTAVAK